MSGHLYLFSQNHVNYDSVVNIVDSRDGEHRRNIFLSPQIVSVRLNGPWTMKQMFTSVIINAGIKGNTINLKARALHAPNWNRSALWKWLW